jgi:hypothetical protein
MEAACPINDGVTRSLKESRRFIEIALVFIKEKKTTAWVGA